MVPVVLPLFDSLKFSYVLDAKKDSVHMRTFSDAIWVELVQAILILCVSFLRTLCGQLQIKCRQPLDNE